MAEHVDHCEPCQHTVHDLEAHKDTLLQGLHLLRKPVGLLVQSLEHALLLLHGLLLHTCSFPQGLILLSQVDDFFFWRHGPTVLGSGLSCKPIVLLNSYSPVIKVTEK